MYNIGDFLITFEGIIFILKSIDPNTNLVYDYAAVVRDNIVIETKIPTCHISDIKRCATLEEGTNFLYKLSLQGKIWDREKKAILDI